MNELTSAIVILIVLVAIICLCYFLRRWHRWGGKNLNYYQGRARENFRNVNDGSWTDTNRNIILDLDTVNDDHKTAYDHFMAGAVYYYSRNNPAQAAEEFKQALTDVERGNVFEDDRDELVPRIRDIVLARPENDGIVNDDELQRAMLDNYQQLMLARTRTSATPPVPRKTEAKTRAAKAVERKAPIITSDGQNVHDGAVLRQFCQNFKHLRIINNLNSDGFRMHAAAKYPLDDPAFVKAELGAISSPNERKLNEEALKQYKRWLTKIITDPEHLDTLKRNANMNNTMADRSGGGTETITEGDVIGGVWRRIHDQDNDARRTELMKNLQSNVVSLHELGGIVCITGRCLQIFSSLVADSQYPELGGFVSSTMLTDSMYSRGAALVDKFIESLPAAERDAFNKSQVRTKLDSTTIAAMEHKFDAFRDELATKLHAEFDAKLTAADVNVALAKIRETIKLD